MKSFALLVLSFGLGLQAWAGRPLRGTYEVPVQDEALKPFASFPVKFKSDSYNENVNQIDFPVPTVLVGEPVTVTMVRDPQTNLWAGPQVNGECQTIGRIMSCRMAFQNLKVDAGKVEAALRAAYPSPSEYENRLQVARSFGGEFIGILNYRLRGGSGDDDNSSPDEPDDD